MQKIKNLRINIESLETLKRHTILVFFSSFFITIIGYIATFYFTHNLPEADLGQYFVFLSYFNIIVLFMCSGLGGGFTKRVSEGREKNEYFSAYLFLTIIFLLITLSILYFVSPYVTQINSNSVFDLLILALIMYSVNTVITNGVVALDKIGIHQTSKLIAEMFKLAVQIIAVFAGYHAGGLIFGFICGIITTIILNIRYFEYKFVKFEIAHIKSILVFSFWILLSSGTVVLYSNIDSILLCHFLDEGNVAVYRIGLQLAALASFVGVNFQTVLLPKISRWDTNKNIQLIEDSISKILILSLVFAIPIFIGGIIIGEELLYYLYGAPYAAGYEAFIILILAQISNSFLFIQITAINSMNQPVLTFITTFTGAFLCIILNILLIPLYGINGAALALLISSFISAIVSFSILRLKLKIKYKLKYLPSIFGAVTIMAIILMILLNFIEINSVFILIAVVMIGAIAYFTSIIKLNHPLYLEILSLFHKIIGR